MSQVEERRASADGTDSIEKSGSLGDGARHAPHGEMVGWLCDQRVLKGDEEREYFFAMNILLLLRLRPLYMCEI